MTAQAPIEATVDRSTGIGGTDVSAILGLNPWRSPVDVWLEKTGRGEPTPDNEAMYWGRVLEDTVASEYARRTGRRVRRVNRTLRHRESPLLMAHIDRKVESEPAVLECKTAGERAADRWGPAGTDEVPEYYLLQVLHYLEVTGYKWAAVAVLIGGRDYRTYEVPGDRELQRRAVDECLQWWARHVDQDVPPEPRDPAEAAKLWPRHRPEAAVTADDEVQAAVAELHQLHGSRKEVEQRERQLKARIQAAMGDAERLVGQDGRTLATWKASRPTQSVDVKALQAAEPEVAERYTIERPGSRRFVLK